MGSYADGRREGKQECRWTGLQVEKSAGKNRVQVKIKCM